MHRSACQSACLALLAVLLSAGSAANASVLTTLPGGPISDQVCDQTVDESGNRQVRVKDRICEVTETRTQRIGNANHINKADAKELSQPVTAIVDFDAIEHVTTMAHVCVHTHSLDQPFTQQRDTLANLPPPLR